MELKIFTDGASWGNPGPAAIGVLILSEDGTELFRISQYIGKATNNQAEYRAVIAALQAAKNFRPEKVTVYLDSELVAKQLSRHYRVKSSLLFPLYKQASDLCSQFASLAIVNIKGTENNAAHNLAKTVLKEAVKSRTVRR